MLKLYDKTNTFIRPLFEYRDLCVETTLETGQKALSFEVPLKPENIATIHEEGYIKTKDYEYVIKEINMENNEFFKIYCIANIESIRANALFAYDAFELNIQGLIAKALENTGWTAEFPQMMASRVSTYRVQYTDSFAMLKTLKQDYDLEYFYDTLRKVLVVYNRMGAEQGSYFMNELKLKMLRSESQSYDYFTKIIPIGRNGLTIETINNGKIYLENYQYSNKVITKYWVQEDYEQAELLKADAQAFLDSSSMPRRSYKADLMSFNNVNIGDNITLIDKLKKIKEKQRVVRIIDYPLTPEKSKVELSNLMINFADMLRMRDSAIDKKIAWIEKNLKELQ